MAAITKNENQNGKHVRYLEDRVVTDLAATETNRRRAVKVPEWAREILWIIYLDSVGGTAPSFSFKLEIPDIGDGPEDINAPDDANVMDLGDWDGITALTAADMVSVDVGPEIAVQDTASAYGVAAVLPPWIVYTTTLVGGGAALEDYTYRILAVFRGR